MQKKESQYDRFAKDFSNTRGHAWDEFEIIFSEIKKGDKILDLGCGNGRFRKFLGTTKISEGAYFGLDLSENLLEIARSNFPEDHFFRGNFGEKFPFGDDNFENVVAIASFHHLTDPAAQKKFLTECYRVLKPGGKIFITTWILPSKYFWKNFWSGRVFTKNWLIPFGKEKHPRIYRNVTEKDLKNLLQKNGFTVKKAEKFQGRNYIALAVKEA